MNFGETHPLNHWNEILGSSKVQMLLDSAVLTKIPSKSLVNWRGFVRLNENSDEFEIVELSGKPHFLSIDFSQPPIEIPNGFEFATLSWESFSKKLQHTNGFSQVAHTLTLPQSLKHIGGLVAATKTVHFLFAPNVGENDVPVLRNFFASFARGDLKFVVFCQDPQMLLLSFGDIFANNVSFGELPTPEKNFKISPSLLYKTDFGFTFEQVLKACDRNTLIIDRQSGRIAFGGKVILKKRDSDQFKFIEHLALRPNERFATDFIAHTLLKKDEWTKSSKKVIDLKNKFIATIELTLKDEPDLIAIAQSMFPKKDRAEFGSVCLCSEMIDIIVLN